MRKAIAVGIALAFVISAAVVLAQSDVIEIGHIAKLYQPSKFNHKTHSAAYKCTDCHHKWDGKEGTKPKKCFDCHKAQAEGDTPNLKTAFHKQCKDCHKKEKAAGKKAPTSCTACHAKKAQ